MSSTSEYVIRESQKSEQRVIMSMMKAYVSEETIYQSFVKENTSKFSEDQKRILNKYVYAFILNLVTNYPSLVVVHTPSQKIVGHVILGIVENPLLAESTKSSLLPPQPVETPEAVDTFLKYAGKFVSVKETFEMNPGLDKLVVIRLLGVVKDHRGKGLSKRLLQRGIEWMKANGLRMAQGTFSSTASKRAGKSVGFRSIWDYDLRNCRSEPGEAVFADAGVRSVVSTMVLEIKD